MILNMTQLSLAGLWQVSPLTDLSIPQDDITFPAPLSAVLPAELSEEIIAQQEWHLMHDFELDEALMLYPAIDLVLSGIDYHAEVRINGVAVFDCDGSQSAYRKDIKPYVNRGGNRVEILFLEEDEDLLLGDEWGDEFVDPIESFDSRMGIWREPYLQFVPHVRLGKVETEQIWHHGGCELLVTFGFETLKPDLVSASVKFDGMTYYVPIDVRASQASVLFQVDAPKRYDPNNPDQDALYQVDVELDGQSSSVTVALVESD